MKPGRYFALAEETKDTKTSAVSKYLTMLGVEIVRKSWEATALWGVLLEKKLATTVCLRVATMATMEWKMEASAYCITLEVVMERKNGSYGLIGGFDRKETRTNVLLGFITEKMEPTELIPDESYFG